MMQDRSKLDQLNAACPDWPVKFKEQYKANGYWQGDTFTDMFAEVCGRYGSKLALIDEHSSCSFRDLKTRSEQLANGFTRLGLSIGDTVVVQLLNRISFVETVLALIHIGVVPVLALPAHRQLEINEFCQFSNAKAYITADQHDGFDYRNLGHLLQARCSNLSHVVIDGQPLSDQVALEALFETQTSVLPIGPRSDDVAVFQISGGTTGIPKLIPRRHQEYLFNMRCAAQASGMNKDTVYLCALPVAHNFSFACPGIFGTLLSGGTVVFAPTADAATCGDLIAKHGVTITSVVPPIAIIWADQADPALFASLQVLQVGGAKLPVKTAYAIGPKLGVKLQQVFGMAEGLICYTDLDGTDQHICETQGVPMCEADEVRVVDEDGYCLANGSVGLIQTRGPYTMRGYYNAPDKNAVALTDDGYYVSGDLVIQQPDGTICVVGREKEQINRGGEKLSGEEIENLLIAHPTVKDAAVVGLPDDILGERICAFVIASDDKIKPLQLRRFLLEQGVAAFKMPDEFRPIAAFPTTGVGKVSKAQLRAELLKTANAMTTKESA